MKRRIRAIAASLFLAFAAAPANAIDVNEWMHGENSRSLDWEFRPMTAEEEQIADNYLKMTGQTGLCVLKMKVPVVGLVHEVLLLIDRNAFSLPEPEDGLIGGLVCPVIGQNWVGVATAIVSEIDPETGNIINLGLVVKNAKNAPISAFKTGVEIVDENGATDPLVQILSIVEAAIGASKH